MILGPCWPCLCLNEQSSKKGFFKKFYLFFRTTALHIASIANKGWSTVNYHQSLAFDLPYLSYNDHCDRWLFQEIFFIIFRSSCMQMFFKTGFARNFAIFTGKHLCWSLFLIKENFISTFSQRDFNTGDFCPVKIVKFFEHLFLWSISGGCFCQFDKELCSMMGICRSSLLNQKHKMWDSFY